MKHLLLAAALLFPPLLPGAAAKAADRVALSVPPPPAPGLAALPRIARPADAPVPAAAETVNAALARLDAAAARAAADCRARNKGEASWERSVDVPLRGPRFLSYVVTDNTFCGGAHPNVGTFALVYDLRTGRPVDWGTLLPPALTGTQSLATADDGTRTVQLASPRLRDLFLETYRSTQDPAVAAECRDVIAQQTDPPPGLTAWLDGKNAALALFLDLPHAVAACAEPVLVPLAVLRREGASPELLEALESAGR